MEAVKIVLLALSLSTGLYLTRPLDDGSIGNLIARKDGLSTAYSANNSAVVFGDLATHSNGQIIVTTLNAGHVLVVDPATSQDVAQIFIPGVQATFGITRAIGEDTFFVVGGNLTDGLPVTNSFRLFEVMLSHGDDPLPSVWRMADFPADAQKPVGSLAQFGDYLYIVDTVASDVFRYQFDTEEFQFDVFNKSEPLLDNPFWCPVETGVISLAIGTDLTLWFSNQVQALTAYVHLDWQGVVQGSPIKNAQQIQTMGSSPACSAVTWKNIAVDADNNQWISADLNQIIRADAYSGQYHTALQGPNIIPNPSALAFGRSVETQNTLYIITKSAASAVSRILAYDVTTYSQT